MMPSAADGVWVTLLDTAVDFRHCAGRYASPFSSTLRYAQKSSFGAAMAIGGSITRKASHIQTRRREYIHTDI